ncbi:hypothetical protein [Bradyrhizobium erythrophlei]|uniref:Uncharacterized protein n=1 Tax=Bradyrhizobium erythrophlei TaxID=1437360 RepID=A0A1M5QS57_9BRAD|nr:hypothetical protein [Bradyrhizobium erythrophlei]SHH16788.1 hypothetical protein SAMN05443248_3933 [Bradyrhizobium erythrophlei]
MNIAAAHMLEPEPIEIDPRPCELCGRTIDQHECVDQGEGPEFHCFPDDDIVAQWELADPRDAWRHTGEVPPAADVRNSDISARPAKAPQYRTPQSTVDAFRLVAGRDVAHLRAWLGNRPKDAPYLLSLLEGQAHD